MKRSVVTALACSVLAIGMVASSGCFWVTQEGPYLGLLSIPIPVSPYFQDKKEDEFWEHERYERVPILGPITAGGPPSPGTAQRR